MNHAILDNIIILLILLGLAASLAAVLVSLVRGTRKTLYSYRNAGLLGGAIYLVFMLGVSLVSVFSGPGMDGDYFNHIVRVYATVAQYFVLILLPLMLLLFLALTVSNISLILHEKKSPKNLLGAFAGIFLVAASLALTFGWDVVYSTVIMDIYNRGHQWIVIFDSAVPTFFSGILGYLQCMMAGIAVLELMAVKYVPEYNKDYVIILGCAVNKEGKPYPLLRGRIERALAFAREQKEKTGKQIRFVPSGGQGADECVSEAQAIKEYLTEHGVDESLILTEDRSESTMENMLFSKALIEKEQPGAEVIFSTTNYHLFRSGIYADKAGLTAHGIGSKTKAYFWPNAFVRELIALLAERKKVHLIAVLLILAFSLLVGYSGYASLFLQ